MSTDRPDTVSGMLEGAAAWLDTYDKLAQKLLADPPVTCFGDQVQQDLRTLAAWYAKLPDLDHAIPLMAFGSD